MEKEINVAEILKDKPKGTKLYDLLYNVDVELDKISTTDTETVVWCTNETDNNITCHRSYSEFGTVRGCPDGLQILLPSKEMRDWSKFAWKKGDVLANNIKTIFIIFNEFEDDTYGTFNGKYCLIKISSEEEYTTEEFNFSTSLFEKANDDEAQAYINTIEERFGGKLNLETLEVEKHQPEFVDLKPKCEFKPFDRCIWKIRNCEGSIWRASFVSYVDEYGAIPMGMYIDEDLVNLIILPYNDETAKLIGTTNNWEG